MGGLITDIRQAYRGLSKKPGFVATAILTLAIGIGACTAIFTVVRGVLLDSLPFPEPDRIVRLYEISDKGSRMNVPEANFVDWHEQSKSFDAMAIHSTSSVTVVTDAGEPDRVGRAQVSREFFDALGVKPRFGRTFVESELEEGAAGVAIVSHQFWRDVLGATSDLSTAKLTIGGSAATVVGVMPDDFVYPPGAALWMPMEAVGPLNPSRSAHNWRVIARLGADTSVEDATAELVTIASRIHDQYDDVTAVGAEAVSLHRQLTESVRKPLMILSGAVLILLLVACANVMNLFLARMATRNRESSIRLALGAGRWRLIRPLIAESLLVTVTGGALGVLLAAWGVDVLLRFGTGLPRTEEINVNLTVLGFSLLLSIVVALIVGTVPGLRLGRGTQAALNEGARGQAGERQNRLRNVLVVAQVGLTLVLLVGAGLLANSFIRLLSVDLGFQTDRRLVATVALPPAPDDESALLRIEMLQRIQQKLGALPGVESVGGNSALPLSRSGSNGRFLIEGGENSGEYWPGYRAASPGYFETLGIPLIEGRTFDESDGPDSPHVAVISSKVAKTVWPEGGAIGKRINTANMDGDEQFMTIVGIVGDVQDQGADAEAKGTVYVNAFQRPAFAGSFMNVLRTTGDPDDLVAEARSAVRAIDPRLPVRFDTLDGLYRSSFARRSLDLSLLLVFGGAALILALLGIYGVMSYSIAKRIPEIGIRMALGAQSADVIWMFVREGAWLVLCGVGGGLLVAIASSRVLASLLFEVDPTDVVTYASVAMPVSVVALMACWIPARQGTRIDPMVALRDE